MSHNKTDLQFEDKTAEYKGHLITLKMKAYIVDDYHFNAWMEGYVNGIKETEERVSSIQILLGEGLQLIMMRILKRCEKKINEIVMSN